jgi:hypothetical protein
MTRDSSPNQNHKSENLNVAVSDSQRKSFIVASPRKKGARYGHGGKYPQRAW